MFATRFSKYAWFVTAFNVLVIIWGAVVRATGSGAGCGSHWPTCNGEVLPSLHQLTTVVEFTHRLTSGAAGFLVLILLIWAFRRQGWRLTRIAAVLSLVFILIEGAIGALLVRLELTAGNASALRAVMIGIHLCNTLLLMAALSLTAWSGSRVPDRRTAEGSTASPTARALLGIGLVLTIILCAAGAVTALGDTLFPSASLAAGLAADADPNAHFLIQLRVIHPIIAITTSIYLLVAGRVVIRLIKKESVAYWFNLLQFFVLLQMTIGAFNVALLAPVVIQVIHLLMADIFWLTMVIWVAEALTDSAPIGARQDQGVERNVPALGTAPRQA